MRNPNRLYNFLQVTYMPDWRVRQFWLNFLSWLQNEKKIDGFFPEEDKMLKYLRKYCREKGGDK